MNRVSCYLLLACLCSSVSAEPTRVLIVVGPSNHPPGSHEVAAGGRLLAHCLQQAENVPDLHPHLVSAWPDDAQLRESVASVVFLGDTFPPNRLPNAQQNLAELGQMMDRGCGIVCLHYATGLLGDDVGPNGEHPLLGWMGGYYANRSCPHHQSIARVYPSAVITPAKNEHPILRGWQEFTIHDEPYINNYFGPDDNQLASNVTALATSLLPPDDPQEETVAWCVERADSGRGFGIVMPHFYRNWGDDDLRRFILNGVVWSAGRDVPKDGVQTPPPDLAQFEPASVEYVRRRRKCAYRASRSDRPRMSQTSPAAHSLAVTRMCPPRQSGTGQITPVLAGVSWLRKFSSASGPIEPGPLGIV